MANGDLFGISFQINRESVASIQRLFTDFDSDMRKKIAGPAFRKGGVILLQDARSRVARGRTRGLHNSLGIKILTENADGFVGVRVYARRKGYKHGYLAHLIEYGSRVVVVRGSTNIGKVKQQVGFQPARPFMRPALDTNQNTVLSVIGAAVNEGIVKAYRKGARNAR